VRRFLKVKKRTHFIDANLLLLDHLFNLADFLLDFARELLVLARGRETGVVGDLPAFSLALPFSACSVP
jgi:hypothetical protein